MTTPWWRPDRLAARRDKLAARGRVKRAVRDFFDAAGYVEVETPALQTSPGLEPHLQAFATVLHDPRDPGARPRYLHTSPEFAMKKLLVGGMDRIWQLAHVYRNGERGATHHPEFAMLEWYRAGASYRDLMGECEGLLRAAQNAAGADAMRRGGHRADATLPFQRLTVAEAFSRYAGIDLLATAPDPQNPDAALLAAEACPHRHRPASKATIGRRCFSAFFWSASSRISGSARRRSFTIIRSRWPRCPAANPTTPARGAVRAVCVRPRTRQRVWRIDRPG